jgi:hypothetical protein
MPLNAKASSQTRRRWCRAANAVRQQTALDAYVIKREECDKLIARLRTEMTKLNDGFTDTQHKDWGFVGSLGHIEKLLRQATDFLGNN